MDVDLLPTATFASVRGPLVPARSVDFGTTQLVQPTLSNPLAEFLVNDPLDATVTPSSFAPRAPEPAIVVQPGIEVFSELKFSFPRDAFLQPENLRERMAFESFVEVTDRIRGNLASIIDSTRGPLADMFYQPNSFITWTNSAV